MVVTRQEHQMISTPLTPHQCVNIFVAGIGQGFKSNLATKGILVLFKESLTDEEVVALW